MLKAMKKKKKRILIIGTGGTIASIKTKQGLRPAYRTRELISFFPEVKEFAETFGIMLFNLDSTNIQPKHWSILAEEIKKQYERYDGFVITHGTDTMHYTGSALSLMLQDLHKTVVLTGSVKAIGEGNDAKQNFIDSVLVASSNVNEVCIVFHGRIIRGSRARKITNEATKIAADSLGVYSSINCHLIGEFIGSIEGVYDRKVVFNKAYKNTRSVNNRKLKVFSKINCSVALVKIHPGFDPEILTNLRNKKCIIVEAFGPGNVPFTDSFLLQKIEALVSSGVSVFITTQNPFGEVDMTLYEVGQKAMRAGAVSCFDMTTETAVVKAMWILGNFGSDPDKIKRSMVKDFSGEINR